MSIHEKYYELSKEYNDLLSRVNKPACRYNGIFTRFENPVLTRDHIPLTWRYDIDKESNPFFMERLGINSVFNSGAIYHDGKYVLCARIEGNDRKSFFGIARSDSPVDGFVFDDYPLLFDDLYETETNIYDMRLTKHEDGWIYGVFCSEQRDLSKPNEFSSVAEAGIVRTHDLINWERLPNLKTLRSSQQRNAVLHPEFVNGKYAFYTRPMDDFINPGSGGGVGFGLADDITNAVVDEEVIISKRKYHQITEFKNGAGCVPIKTDIGWIHIAHAVRETAAGLRYVLYCFVTDKDDPFKTIYEPSGLLLGPLGEERIGDVADVTFSNGAIVNDKNEVYIYYGASDTRLNVVKTDIDRLMDYCVNTPSDPGRSHDCTKQRIDLIDKNLKLL